MNFRLLPPWEVSLLKSEGFVYQLCKMLPSAVSHIQTKQKHFFVFTAANQERVIFPVMSLILVIRIWASLAQPSTASADECWSIFIHVFFIFIFFRYGKGSFSFANLISGVTRRFSTEFELLEVSCPQKPHIGMHVNVLVRQKHRYLNMTLQFLPTFFSSFNNSKKTISILVLVLAPWPWSRL